MRKTLLILTLLLVLTMVFSSLGFAAKYDWRPNKPINLIVPWGAGGSTDRSARAAAEVVSDALGVKIVVVNQPGSSGAVGTNNAFLAPRDGYTWTAGAVKDLALYKAQGLLDTVLDDWHIFVHVAMPSVISVNVNSPYKDFGDLLAAFKAKTGAIKVATAGINSAGAPPLIRLRSTPGFTYSHVTYDGGNPAVIAVVSGECEVVPQLSVEQVDMIRAKRLRPLAVLADKLLEIAGYNQLVPPITNWIPDFEASPSYFGIFVPKGVPDEVIYTLNEIWDGVVMNSDMLKKWAQETAVIFDPAYGAQAVTKSFPQIQLDAWLKYEAGDLVVDPVKVGIPRP